VILNWDAQIPDFNEDKEGYPEYPLYKRLGGLASQLISYGYLGYTKEIVPAFLT
jgi:hypothetical protein